MSCPSRGVGKYGLRRCIDKTTRMLHKKRAKKDQIQHKHNEDQQNKITRKQKWGVKQLYGNFKRQTRELSHKKTWVWLEMENLKRETESLLIATQNNVKRTNSVKAKTD